MFTQKERGSTKFSGAYSVADRELADLELLIYFLSAVLFNLYCFLADVLLGNIFSVYLF